MTAAELIALILGMLCGGFGGFAFADLNKMHQIDRAFCDGRDVGLRKGIVDQVEQIERRLEAIERTLSQ